MVITSPFGWRIHPTTGARSFHEGVDIRAAEGTPIRAMWAGTVARVRRTDTSGLAVTLDHGDGVQTYYAHLSAVHFRPGDYLDAGETFASSGATGRVTGPHLHLAIYLRGRAVNPALFF